MRKHLILIFLFLCLSNSYAQKENKSDFSLTTGLVYNQSNMKWNTTTAVGIYFEPKIYFNERLIIGYRLEPVGLAYGVLLLPGGCTQVHRQFPGMPSCREGSNFLINNYFFMDKRLGNQKIGKKGGVYQLYSGLSINIHTHHRYIITSRRAGNWEDAEAWITNLGLGYRLGALLGRTQLNLSFNITGSDFQPFLGMSFGYILIK
ncbi:hypothetical protein [Aquiflexum lacus]|uniref:hypothetical protein n=1 Tax=Aquiflexum lacus TaxID=2483805 RepID=UPI00189532A1|nr:hypothetical protein [Aquiflexum lacus]